MGKYPLVYFDNGATTQKPQVVIDAEANYYANENSNVHRGVHFLSGLATDKFEETRISVKNFINTRYEITENNDCKVKASVLYDIIIIQYR